MKNKLKKIYGRFTVEIFDDDEALGLKDTVSINENTPERYKKAVKTILTTLSEEYPLLVISKADTVQKQNIN